MRYTSTEKTCGRFPRVSSVLAGIPTVPAFCGVMSRVIWTRWNTCPLTWSIMLTPSWSCFWRIWLSNRHNWLGSSWRHSWRGPFHWHWWVRSGVACAHWSRYLYAPIRSNRIATLSGSGGEQLSLQVRVCESSSTHPFQSKTLLNKDYADVINSLDVYDVVSYSRPDRLRSPYGRRS